MKFSVTTFIAALAFNGALAMPTSIETPQNDITIGEIEKSMGANGQSQRRDNVFARVTECYKSAIPCTTNEFCHAQAGCSGCLFFVVTVGGICF